MIAAAFVRLLRTWGQAIAWGCLVALLTWAVCVPRVSAAPRKIALVASIEGDIDLGLSPYVERVLKQAAEERAALVILDVNTFGGRVDAAVAIRDHLLGSSVPTVAFVNPRAISAGALISLAAHKIAISRGGTIGAATPVMMGEPGEGPKATDEKTVSYVRKEFRATADARQRPGAVAEAMVDRDVAIEGVVEKGKLLTLTTEDALRVKIADFEANSLQEVLTKLELGGAELRHVEENWAESVVRFLTNPILSSLLMSLGLVGLLVEIRSPGVGLPGLVGVLSLAAFFWGHWLVELVGWEQLLLVGAGLVLLGLEIFVFPGFGVAGVLGIVALVAGLSSSLFGAGASLNAILYAVARVALAASVALVLSVALMRLLPSLPGGHKLVLGTAIANSERPDAVSLVGMIGTALSPLRPAGIASLDGRRVDVVSDGEFIESGQPIEVVRDEGHRVVVRRQRPAVS